jgi:hypothetical protein
LDVLPVVVVVAVVGGVPWSGLAMAAVLLPSTGWTHVISPVLIFCQYALLYSSL